MKRIKAFYPQGTDKILHVGEKGNSYYLDAIDIPLRIHQELIKNPSVEVVEVDSRDDSVLSNSHSRELLESYKTGEPRELAESSGLMWNEAFYRYIVNTAWVSINAFKEAVQSGKSVAITQGGHHAEYEIGRGFGPIGNMIIAAKELISSGEVERVAILDLDVHFANGTHSLVYKNDNILSCDLWKYKLPYWKYTPNNKNVYHLKVIDSKDYKNKLTKMFDKVINFNPDLLIIFNGLDVLGSDRTGGIPGFNEAELDYRNKSVGKFIKENDYPTSIFTGGGYIDYSKPEDVVVQAKNTLTKLYVKSIFSILGLQ